MQYWLLKTEPSSFSVEDLQRAPRRTACWDGVRNYQARNMLRDSIKRGDRALLYHSSCAEPGIVAILEVVKEGYPDPTAFEPKHEHFDPASRRDAPRWFMVDVRLERRLARLIALEELRANAGGKLRGMSLLRAGNRLSVMPVDALHWKFILSLE
ncbi:MAG TPA: EVE domain-containing protein [Steroidobacteraceae bacterium]|nr:EVE domain-containing protein [Steroidobacteraceae bacterium]